MELLFFHFFLLATQFRILHQVGYSEGDDERHQAYQNHHHLEQAQCIEPLTLPVKQLIALPTWQCSLLSNLASWVAST